MIERNERGDNRALVQVITVTYLILALLLLLLLVVGLSFPRSFWLSTFLVWETADELDCCSLDVWVVDVVVDVLLVLDWEIISDIVDTIKVISKFGSQSMPINIGLYNTTQAIYI